MAKVTTWSLPHDLPENWTSNNYVSPNGTDVGLTAKHGYNYLMKQVNNSHRAFNEMATNVEKLVHSEGTTPILGVMSSYTSIHNLITTMHNAGYEYFTAIVGAFVDLPVDNAYFHLVARRGDADVWNVQVMEPNENWVFFRNLTISGGWIQPQWDEVMHTGSYQRLSGLAPAALES